MINQFTVDNAKNHAAHEMERLFAKVPFAREFHTGASSHPEYYKRHLMETILRIRLNNEVDAYCLYKIGYKNNKLAVKLAQYLAEELGHENFFLQDLKGLGVEKDELDATAPFFSTEKLIGYLYHAINHDGPMPTMVWNWFVEWYSDTYNKTITEKATNVVGEKGTKGFKKHIEFDDKHDHISLMFGTVEQTVVAPEDHQKVKNYLTNFIELIGEYFQELHDTTIAMKRRGE
jgi:Iron-containing redox enzyme